MKVGSLCGAAWWLLRGAARGEFYDTIYDAAHYNVTVNGKAVTVESAGYNANNHGVALGLADGALQAGDKVVVTYTGLSDSKGATVAGQSEMVTAK